MSEEKVSEMLLVSVLIHAMMQQLTLAEGFDCSKISCTSDCPLDFKRTGPSPEVFFHLSNSTFNAHSNDPHAKEFYSSQSRSATNSHLRMCCSLKCQNYCTTSDNRIVPEGTQWDDIDDPCTSHICDRGIVSNHTSACMGLPCPREHHSFTQGKCCPTCNSNWASFCPEVEDCDIACQYSFVVDHQRGCDLCRCEVRRTESTASVMTSTTTTETSRIDDATRGGPFYFYLDPTDAATKNLVVGIAIACGVILVACLAGIGWYFHRKVYRKVPLLSLRSSSA